MASAAAEAAQQNAASKASPKGSAPQESPGPTIAASRTNPSSFAPRPTPAPPPQVPGAPLIAARSVPIDALNPYTNKWQIKARVVNKGEMRTFNSAKGGEGRFFSMDLSDDSGEIRATAWKEVAERLYPMVEAGNTYLIARGQLKVANKKFNSLNNSYEVTLSYDTQLQLCADEPASRPKTHYRFCSIGDIANRPKDATVDVIGVVSQVSATQTMTSQRTGKELVKRTMVLADDSGKSIELTLWGANASSFPEMDASQNEVVAFKGMRVSEWNQRSLGAVHSSSYEVNPELEATERLKSWWDGGGKDGGVESLSMDMRNGGAGGPARDTSARTTAQDFYDQGEGLTSASEPVYASIRCYFSKLTLGGSQGQEERLMWYGACPKCNKKVVGDEASGHSCENCGWSGAECTYRYILPLQAVDASGHLYLTAFNEQATQIMGISATELKRLKDTSPAGYDEVIAKAMWKQYVLRVRGKMDTYNNVTRLKTHVIAPAPVKWAEEGKLLLDDIAKYDLTGPTEVKMEA